MRRATRRVVKLCYGASLVLCVATLVLGAWSYVVWESVQFYFLTDHHGNSYAVEMSASDGQVTLGCVRDLPQPDSRFERRQTRATQHPVFANLWTFATVHELTRSANFPPWEV